MSRDIGGGRPRPGLASPRLARRLLDLTANDTTTCREYKCGVSTMLTKYLTGVTTAFSPFNARSGKTVRNFLALLPPNARSTMAIDVKMFGQSDAQKPATLSLKFSMSAERRIA